MMTPDRGIHAVTGAYGYSGKYIAGRLLERGRRVITLTNSPDRPDPFQGKVPAHRFHFDNPGDLERSLEGVSVLYNTYWVRFNHRGFTFADAVRNSRTLFEAAKKAGVRRIVHVSITNPSEDSRLEYFSGKANVEHALRETGLSHAILRPAVLFGHEDILINNIAWTLRRFPVFSIFGDGKYRLQPIHVDDFAEIAVREGEKTEDTLCECIGPETFTYRGLVEEIEKTLGIRRWLVCVPPRLGHLAGYCLGRVLGDVLITRDEIRGLMEERLYVDAPPAGTTRLTDWTCEHADSLGRRYASELARRRDRNRAYGA